MAQTSDPRQVFGCQLANFGCQKFAPPWKEIARCHLFWSEMVVGYRETCFNFSSKILTELKITCSLMGKCLEIHFQSLSLNSINSSGNLSCVLVTTCEILVASTQFLVALAIRKVQFWTLTTSLYGKLTGTEESINRLCKSCIVG